MSVFTMADPLKARNKNFNREDAPPDNLLYNALHLSKLLKIQNQVN